MSGQRSDAFMEPLDRRCLSPAVSNKSLPAPGNTLDEVGRKAGRCLLAKPSLSIRSTR